jgi:hypothetical protein
MTIGKLTSLAVVGSNALELEWDDGVSGRVDLTDLIASRPGLKGIRSVRAFSKAAISDDGWSVEWSDGVDFGAPQLRRWMDEQAGEAMPAAEFRQWVEHHDLTLDAAASELGLSRRMIAYYLSGEKAIPKTVLLATQGWQKQKRRVDRRTAVSESRIGMGYTLRVNEGRVADRKIARDSKSGEFVSVKAAKNRPSTTVVERVPRSDHGNSKKK